MSPATRSMTKQISSLDVRMREGTHSKGVFQVAEWCRDKNIMFKLNTVVNKYNWEEDMNNEIDEIKPFRWKVFQVLLLEGENTGPNALRDAKLGHLA